MRFAKVVKTMFPLVILSVTPAFADVVLTTSSGFGSAGFILPVTPTATGNYPSGGGITDPNTGRPLPFQGYWDHPSYDAQTPASTCNAGWVVNGGMSGCNSTLGPGFSTDDKKPNSYWSRLDGSADTNFWFNNSPTPDSTELELTITGYDATDKFGYYVSDSAGTIGATQLLFDGGSPVEKIGLNITDPFFGFYLTNGVGQTFYTYSSGQSADAGIQHFATFRVAPTGINRTANDYYMAVEDLGGKSDFDYNDFMVHIQQAPIPEPSAFLLFGTMLAGCGIAFRRLRKS